MGSVRLRGLLAATVAVAGLSAGNASAAVLWWPASPSGAGGDVLVLGRAGLRTRIFEAFDRDDIPSAVALLGEYLEKHPEDGLMLYNAACAHSRLGDLDAAEQMLRRAIAAGYIDCSQFRRDPDLVPLRDRPVLRAILAARDAADGLISTRALDQWRETYGDRYAVTMDEQRKLNLVTTLPPASQDQLMLRIQRQADHLVQALFEIPLRHTVLVALADPDDAVGIFESPAVSGHYHHRGRRMVVADIEPSLNHELVHAYHNNHMDDLGQEHPIWIREGLASLYERYRFDEELVIDYVTNERDVLVRDLHDRDELVPWPLLFVMERRVFKDRGEERYAQARSIFMYLADRGKLSSWYRAYVESYDRDHTGVLALETVFDQPLEQIEAAWRRWIERRELDQTPVLTTIGHRHVIEAEPAVDAEAATDAPEPVVLGRPEPARLAYQRGRTAYRAGLYADAVALFRDVVEQLPEDADVRYELGLTYVRLGDVRGVQRQIERLEHLDPSLASLLANLARMMPAVAPEPARERTPPEPPAPRFVDPKLRHLEPDGDIPPSSTCAPTRGCARPRTV